MIMTMASMDVVKKNALLFGAGRCVSAVQSVSLCALQNQPCPPAKVTVVPLNHLLNECGALHGQYDCRPKTHQVNSALKFFRRRPWPALVMLWPCARRLGYQHAAAPPLGAACHFRNFNFTRSSCATSP